MINEIVELSKIDQDRFGIKTAKTKQINSLNLEDILAFCIANDVKLLISRLPVSDIKSIHTLEASGFHLMQTLLYFRFDLINSPLPETKSKVIIREVKPGEESKVAQVARKSFTGYLGHYHADPKLDQHDCTEVYSSWAHRCCVEPGVADRVFIAEVDGNIAGFRAIRMNSSNQGEMLLAAVLPETRNKGIYTSFVIKALNWCHEKGAKEVITSTLILNIGVQKACVRLGFVPKEAFYTYHKWFHA
jgi:GNAT superfamily N-acetyltransferase